MEWEPRMKTMFEVGGDPKIEWNRIVKMNLI